MAWLSGWSYAKEISLTGQSGAGTLYQVDLDIGASAGGDFHLEGHCTNFPQDIEITDDNGTTLLDFWIEDLTADPIKMWVEVADDLGSNQKIWVYYRKSGASTNSDGGNTFIGFDNIADGDTRNGPLISTTTNFASSDYSRSGGYSAKYTEADGTYINTAIWPSALSLDDHIVSFWIYFTATAGRRATLGSRDSAGVDRGIFLKFENGIVYRFTGSYIDSGMTFSAGWNQIEWIPGATISPIRMNGGSWVNVDHYQTLSGFKQIWQISSSDLDLDYFDEYLARKYNSPEPAFSSAGAEQSAPSGRTTYNARATSNVHPGVMFQTLTGGHGY